MKKTDKENKLLKEICDYLKTKGWGVLTIGGMRIEQRSFTQKYKFEFVVNFVGKKKEKKYGT